MKSDSELKQLAADIYENKVFTDRHVPISSKTDLTMIFLLIALGAFSEMPKEEVGKIGLVYEYIEKAGPRSINGFPIFMSLNYISQEEASKVYEYHNEYKSLKESFLKS